MSESSKAGIRRTLQVQYSLYFGVLGIFLPYFNLYCYHIGFSGFQIGVLSALRTLTTAMFPLLWGALADRYEARKPIYVFCCCASTALWGLYLLTVDFGIMLAITAVYGFFFAPIISFLETFTMEFLGDERRLYGRLRVWGSFSFIAIVMVVGRLVEIVSLKMILVFILGGSLLQALLSVRMPGLVRRRTGRSGQTRALGQAPVIGFLLAAFLMLASHGAYYGFFSIHLESLGFGRMWIGICWALAVAAEILVMILSGRLFQRFSLQAVLVFSCLAAGVRWGVLSLTASVPVILFTQALHAFSYGTFHMASILRIDELMPAESKTVGQAANNAVTYGFGMMVGLFGSGLLYEALGGFALFAISSIAAVCAGAVLLLFPKRGAAIAI